MSHPNYHHRNLKALLTPAMHGVLERMARAGHLPLHALNADQARAAYAAGAGVLEEQHITYFFNHYVRDVRDRDDWRFAPLDGVGEDGYVVDLAGVAPVWMGLAECDPLVDEGIAYGI